MSPNPNLSVGSVQPHHSCVYITMEFDALAQISILESPLWPSTPPDHVGFGAAPAWHNIYGYLMWTYVLSNSKQRELRLKMQSGNERNKSKDKDPIMHQTKIWRANRGDPFHTWGGGATLYLKALYENLFCAKCRLEPHTTYTLPW